jgi:hypothetical protein
VAEPVDPFTDVNYMRRLLAILVARTGGSTIITAEEWRKQSKGHLRCHEEGEGAYRFTVEYGALIN